MKCLIAMCCYDTIENKRTEYTHKTFNKLIATTNPETTRIFIIDNDSCKSTKNLLRVIERSEYPNVTVIYNDSNLGTAEAINLAFKHRQPDEYCVKIDNDVLIYDKGWVEKMIQAFTMSPKLGILGLKRKDLPNSPTHETYKTNLFFLHENNGDPWIPIESCNDIIGTCIMLRPELLDKIGYLYQPGIYGFDDVLVCERSILSGYYNAFLPSIEIDHIDDGKTPFTEWKKRYAGIYLSKIDGIKEGYRENPETIYYNPFK